MVRQKGCDVCTCLSETHFCLRGCRCNVDMKVERLQERVESLLLWREEVESTLKWLPQELENELNELNAQVPQMFQGLTSPLVLRIKALLLKLSRRMETNEGNDGSP